MKVVTTVVGILAVAGVVLASPAGADAQQDQRFLGIVHANGVAGQNESLVAYAQEWCNTNGPYPTVFPLMGQGVWGGQFYKIQVAASQTYCPMKIAMPPQQGPSFHDLTH
jgi:hypothetical protein